MSENKIFAAMTYSSEEILRKVVDELKKHFGEVDFKTEPYDFDKFTKYYEGEMGSNLMKKFAFFKRMSNENMADAKKFTIDIEKKFAINGKRRINIDPGYMSKDEMGLPSTKPLQSRKLIKDGIYNQVIYTFEDGNLREAERAFPDYRSEEVKDIFAKAFKSLQA